MPQDVSENQLRLMVAIRDSESVQTTEMLGGVRGKDRTSIGSENARKALSRLETRDEPMVGGEGHGKQRTWWLTELGTEHVNGAKPKTEPASAVRSYTVLEALDLRELLIARLLPQTLMEGTEGKVDLGLVQLEQLLAKLPELQVFIVAETVEARNTEHAYRQVGKQHFARQAHMYERHVEPDGSEYITVPAIAIDGKRWQVRELDVGLDPSVKVR